MKKLLAALAAVCLLCLCVSASGSLPNGSFSGAAQGRGGMIEVAVRVEDGCIAAIEVDAPYETPSKLQQAMQIVGRMLGLSDYASVQAVDTISGATMSSEGIKNAVLDALKAARPQWGHTAGEPCPSAGFADAPAFDSWAHAAVDWAVSEEILLGVSGTRLSPELPCTRAQLVTFLWRAAGAPIEYGALRIPFADVQKTDWYAQAVHWAVKNGVTTGVDATRFAPDAACTRAQAATFLWRMAGQPDGEPGAGFSDVAQDSWYAAAICWAAGAGITEGVGNGVFSPSQACTRAQALTLLFRARDLAG